MKYCIPFVRNSKFKYYDEVDEISIIYNAKDDTLPEFLDQYTKNHTIVIEIHQQISETDIKLFKALYEKYVNIKFCLVLDNNYAEMGLFMKNDLPFFCNNMIDSFDELYGLLAMRVTDIYITNSLCFDLPTVKAISLPYKTNIRVIPNVTQSRWEATPDARKFWIRPEDVKYYEGYIDTICFASLDENLNTYYEIYEKDKEWFGDLKEIIGGLSDSLDSRCIPGAFAKTRLKCGQRCLRGKRCSICDSVAKLAKTLQEHNFIFEQE